MRLVPRRIAVQVTLVMVTALLAMSGIIFLLFVLVNPTPPDTAHDNLVYGLVLSKLDSLPASERPDYLHNLKVDGLAAAFHLLSGEQAEALLAHPEQVPLLDGGRYGRKYAPEVLPSGVELIREIRFEKPEGKGPTSEVLFQLDDGSFVCISTKPDNQPPLLFNPIFQALLTLGLAVVLLLTWVTITLIRPLSDLARSAAKFGQSSTIPVPIIERGPAEVRAVTRAFNLMQERIQDMISKRTRMLAAVGHDLRTPLTRLKLRISLLDDEEQKQRNLADLDMMEIQLNGALSLMRGGLTGERAAPIDVASFLKGIADQYEDMGRKVPVSSQPGLKIHARPIELNRALTNLVDNSFHFGDEVEIEAHGRGDHLVIDVIDHGPGIAADARERLMEPFERGDVARTYGKGAGFGLGLSITSSIAQAHGGELELLDTPGGGLTARLRMPLG
ncbi:ATP-binding protein [Roseibium limicola]|uniref:histidine kinase n=1 Tax=Roseibium limicola TaxID=2816037 RepID=A0A939EKW9_9HYPH|nr:ATP-binding protein [Roseibium limicola]MBO0343682.1 HAMP domain-containing protein [Roseibium limicola]